MSDPAAEYARAKEMLAAGDAAGARGPLAAAAAAGHAKACHRLGELLLEDGDGAGAVPLLRQAAAAGVARAQFRLGLLLARGEAGLAQDRAAAVDWCTPAPRQGRGVA
ncbi:MAG: hypothetical protein L6R48_09865, partial [Planctomycetes bacterium]|nr:hypothetical protein [Planctomycetota bacterium]